MDGDRTPAGELERLRKDAKRRLKALRANDVRAWRWYRAALDPTVEPPTLRSVQHALARHLDFRGWEALTASLRRPLPAPDSREGIVARFLDNACPDHHVRGRQDHRRAEHTAMRLLEAHPWLATHDLATAVVCGEIDAVRQLLVRDPAAARASTDPVTTRALAGGANDLYRYLGPKGWAPLLYLAFSRLPLAASIDNAPIVARTLLDAGADPNAFFHAGDSKYSPMTGAAGEGEEDRPPHPRRNELVHMLLDAGADPYDIQVVYNLGFHSEYLWWLPMIHARSVAMGREDDWRDPEWRMLDMGGYGCGARWFLDHAIAHGQVDLAAWCLAHGASANAPPSSSGHRPRESLHASAVRAGQPEIAELLVRYGATPSPVTLDPVDMLIAAARKLDRDAVVHLIQDHPELLRSPRPLHDAAAHDRADVIRLLVDAGYSPDVADAQNTRALHRAAFANAASAARALIDAGAEIDPVERNYGGTPLGNAAHFLNREVMDVLIPLTTDVWNLTYDGQVERLQTVLAERPERARVDWGTWSPLLWLPPHDEERALAIARMLVEHGADPARRDENGIAPADRAEAIGMTRVAEYLRR